MTSAANPSSSGDRYSVLRAQGYHLVGSHSAVKTCHWTREAILGGEFCYKGKFYGIRSHRCLQMTPAVSRCSNACVYCWRILPSERGFPGDDCVVEDHPVKIVEESIRAQRRALSGFKGNPMVDRARFREAMDPKHAAISLSGEPTEYSMLDELIGEFARRGMTTFLVTNGINPRKLGELKEPTQLYVSLSAPSEEVYRLICRPTRAGSWKMLIESLSMLSSFSCPTVVRVTAVRNLNMVDPEGYARLISSASPTYVEVKAYMHVGFSVTRLGFESMPSHEEVLRFASSIGEYAGYEPVDESPISRVVLLSRIGKPKKVS
ncbi:MAG: 4-demethylwyosine synthase TYW1 [Candidatus Verstraetearchaeota archaeon]|nr:4-demethylwyosine synthase TYW1 [Candidatus Verstraetearchaeota archaeon]